ncbi:hypothetical protein T492DRAFT_851315 [Pavlovales sp. CCMP2436]|nr:hypothetical protein T492DRAFT_851315 [Pavlovales sp. CCMP2436]
MNEKDTTIHTNFALFAAINYFSALLHEEYPSSAVGLEMLVVRAAADRAASTRAVTRTLTKTSTLDALAVAAARGCVRRGRGGLARRWIARDETRLEAASTIAATTARARGWAAGMPAAGGGAAGPTAPAPLAAEPSAQALGKRPVGQL